MINNADRSLEKKLVYDLNQVKQQLDEMKANQANSIFIGTINTATVTISAGSYALFTYTLTPANNQVLSAISEFAIYLNSVSAANRYPDGANWSNEQKMIVESWLDQGVTDNKNLVFKLVIKNTDVGSVTVVVKQQWRSVGGVS